MKLIKNLNELPKDVIFKVWSFRIKDEIPAEINGDYLFESNNIKLVYKNIKETLERQK